MTNPTTPAATYSDAAHEYTAGIDPRVHLNWGIVRAAFDTGYRSALTDVALMLRTVSAVEVMPLTAEQLTISAPIGRTTELALRHAAYFVTQMPTDHQAMEATGHE